MRLCLSSVYMLVHPALFRSVVWDLVLPGEVQNASLVGHAMSRTRLALSLEMLKSFPSVLVLREIPSAAGPNACFNITAKKIPNRVGARTQPCFTPLRLLNAADVELSKTTVPFMSSWKDLLMLRSWISDLGNNFGWAIPTDQIKSLCEVYEGNEEWLPLLPAFLLKLSE